MKPKDTDVQEELFEPDRHLQMLEVQERLQELDRRIDNARFLLGFKVEARDKLIAETRMALGREICRTKFIDFDARNEPKTDDYCICCQRDIKPSAIVPTVHVVLLNGAPHSLHPEDILPWKLGILSLPAGAEDHGAQRIGACCAKKHGDDWTIKPSPPEPEPEPDPDPPKPTVKAKGKKKS